FRWLVLRDDVRPHPEVNKRRECLRLRGSWLALRWRLDGFTSSEPHPKDGLVLKCARLGVDGARHAVTFATRLLAVPEVGDPFPSVSTRRHTRWAPGRFRARRRHQFDGTGSGG